MISIVKIISLFEMAKYLINELFLTNKHLFIIYYTQNPLLIIQISLLVILCMNAVAILLQITMIKADNSFQHKILTIITKVTQL